MSYCRFSEDSDVYLYPHVYGNYQCCACKLGEMDILLTLEEVLKHLQAHRNAGHKVPEYAFERVEAEIKELDPDYDNSLTEEQEEEFKRLRKRLGKTLYDYKRGW